MSHVPDNVPCLCWLPYVIWFIEQPDWLTWLFLLSFKLSGTKKNWRTCPGRPVPDCPLSVSVSHDNTATALPNPRDIALTLLQRHTSLPQLPTLPFQYQNTFDYYLDEPQTFSFEEPGHFSQFFGNLGSPILQATSADNSVRITALPEDTHHFYEPEDNLPPI